ncbi:hypothetical protein WN51_05528 [Melipona quadrifasciata]|uniref:Uncharacterized protein n=1 Tax=Melipona quadrifasciata TaxID=166423 RepID=A0A0M8ZR11_9HYME|nr:hypothetical protein WN51_05528 [Melipona quadrifasciata]
MFLDSSVFVCDNIFNGATFLDKVLATTSLTFGTLSEDISNKVGNISWENLSPLMALLEIILAQREANTRDLSFRNSAFTRRLLSERCATICVIYVDAKVKIQEECNADIRTNFDSSLRCVAKRSASSNRRCSRVMQQETGIMTSTHAFLMLHVSSQDKSTNIGNCNAMRRVLITTVVFVQQRTGTIEDINRTVPLIKAGCDTRPSHHITTTLIGGTAEFAPVEYLEREEHNRSDDAGQRRGNVQIVDVEQNSHPIQQTDINRTLRPIRNLSSEQEVSQAYKFPNARDQGSRFIVLYNAINNSSMMHVNSEEGTQEASIFEAPPFKMHYAGRQPTMRIGSATFSSIKEVGGYRSFYSFFTSEELFNTEYGTLYLAGIELRCWTIDCPSMFHWHRYEFDKIVKSKWANKTPTKILGVHLYSCMKKKKLYNVQITKMRLCSKEEYRENYRRNLGTLLYILDPILCEKIQKKKKKKKRTSTTTAKKTRSNFDHFGSSSVKRLEPFSDNCKFIFLQTTE